MNTLTPVRSIRVPLKWTTVTDSDDPAWCFGLCSTIGQDLLQRICGPHVYRFRFAPFESGDTWIYVGQSERFEKRCSSYIRALSNLRKPAKTATETTVDTLAEAWKEMARNPCVRIAAAIQNAAIDRRKVELQLLDFEEFSLNGVPISPESFGSPFVRCLVENIAILDTDRLGIHLMNQGRTREAKDFSLWMEARRNKYRKLNAS
jgi:hypothetical protein